jgi:hypothetical protein
MQPTDPAPSLPDRRSFLWSVASLGVAGKALALKPQKDSETVYRFTTPACDVQMSVEYFGSSEVHSLRFRDFLSHRAFCLSANGADDPGCFQRFSGSLAIAHYRFRSRHHARMPITLRERVLTIDHDCRLDPRPPFEKLLAVDRGAVSDIQAFGYNPQNLGASAAGASPLPLWCLLRQDLYLNEEASAFLVAHWKHTFDGITLLDVIPGERTDLVSA